MKTIEEVEVGDVVRFKKHLSDTHIRGSIYRHTAIDKIEPGLGANRHDIFHFEQIVGSQAYKYGMAFHREDLNEWVEVIENEEDEILREHCIIKRDQGRGRFYVEDQRESPEYMTKLNVNLTYEELSKLFKYIPIKYKGQLGFYHNGNIIVKVKPIPRKKIAEAYYDDREGRAKTKYRYTKGTLKSTIKYIPLDIKDVSKYYSQEPLIENCKIKITGYKQSSKFFQYSGEKKELLDKTLEVYDKNQVDPTIKKLTFNIIEVKLKDTIKKSTELQNTISINGQTRKLRFVWDEIEIIYPNINSWKPTIRGFIKEGCKVKTRNKRKSRIINKNELVVVNSMKQVGNKVYISFEHNKKQYYDNIRNYKVVNN